MRHMSLCSLVWVALLGATCSMANPVFDYPNTTLECATSEDVSICSFPSGTGQPLTEALVFAGGEVDATLTLYLDGGWDENPMPLANYPADHIWLAYSDGGPPPDSFDACEALHPDGPTDEYGFTHWTLPFAAGGWLNETYGQFFVVILEPGGEVNYLLHHPHQLVDNIRCNSPDIDASGVVDLSDIVAFTVVLFAGEYDYRCDFVYDGEISLPDVAVMTQGNGTSCP